MVWQWVRGGVRENGSGAYWFEVGIGLRRPLYKWVWKGEKGKEIWGEYVQRRSGAISASCFSSFFAPTAATLKE